jgi:predicted enzyme related to lactoylglutathione lyase
VPNPVIHWEIAAQDRKKLQQFFADLFGWKVNDDNPMQYGVVDSGPGGINGGIMQCQGPQPAYVTFYVSVDNPAATLEKATSLGGKVCLPATPIPNVGTIGMFQDPEGHVIGVIKMDRPPA